MKRRVASAQFMLLTVYFYFYGLLGLHTALEVKQDQVLTSDEIQEVFKCFGDLDPEEGCVICRFITQKIYKVLDLATMCPDTLDSDFLKQRAREWKADPSVLNKWMVMYNSKNSGSGKPSITDQDIKQQVMSAQSIPSNFIGMKNKQMINNALSSFFNQGSDGSAGGQQSIIDYNRNLSKNIIGSSVANSSNIEILKRKANQFFNEQDTQRFKQKQDPEAMATISETKNLGDVVTISDANNSKEDNELNFEKDFIPKEAESMYFGDSGGGSGGFDIQQMLSNMNFGSGKKITYLGTSLGSPYKKMTGNKQVISNANSQDSSAPNTQASSTTNPRKSSQEKKNRSHSKIKKSQALKEETVSRVEAAQIESEVTVRTEDKEKNAKSIFNYSKNLKEDETINQNTETAQNHKVDIPSNHHTLNSHELEPQSASDVSKNSALTEQTKPQSALIIPPQSQDKEMKSLSFKQLNSNSIENAKIKNDNNSSAIISILPEFKKMTEKVSSTTQIIDSNNITPNQQETQETEYNKQTQANDEQNNQIIVNPPIMFENNTQPQIVNNLSVNNKRDINDIDLIIDKNEDLYDKINSAISNPPQYSSFLEVSSNSLTSSKPIIVAENSIKPTEPHLTYDKSIYDKLVKNNKEFNLETMRRGRRRSRFPDQQWDCGEIQITKLLNYFCEEEVSLSYQKYCKPIFEQINTLIESFLYHDNNLEICQNLHMCPFTVDK